MKTKIIIRLAAILIAVIGISTTGCKKDNNPNTDSLQQLSKDEVAMQAATDDMLNDANNILSGGNKKSLETMPCNVTVDSSSVVGDTITYAITFSGLNCAGTHNRVGNITIKRNINTPWAQAGTKVFVHIITLTVTKVSTNKSITFTGDKTFENVSGHVLAELGGSITSIVHKITGSLHATFDDGTTRIWNIARQRTFTGTPGNLVVTNDGFGSADGYSNLVVWGTNRHGELFYTQISQSVVFRQSCGWDPVAGIKVHQIPSDDKSATVTFGYDDNNQPVTGTNCPTRYKVDWQKGTHSGTIYLQLP